MRGYSVITKRSDFLAANRGKRQATPGFVLLVFDRRDDDPAKRLGITITKKVGKPWFATVCGGDFANSRVSCLIHMASAERIMF
jgi:hypothetical protein